MKPFRIFVFLSALVLLPPASARGQGSILVEIERVKGALVSVQAEIASVFQSADGPRAAIDKQTGRLVVLRNVGMASYRRAGAGVIVHPSGIIVTNAHVVDKANILSVVLEDQTVVPAQIVRVVNNLDVALLKIIPPRPLPAVPLADSDHVRLGDEIITVGNSEFLKQTVTGGKITGLGTSQTAQKMGMNRTELIQTSVNLYEGDSGGPLFNRDCHLIGMMTAKETSADHSSFAIPSNKIRQYLVEYLATLQPAPRT